MSGPCICRSVLSILVIAFAWIPSPWARWGLTVCGVLLLAGSLFPRCFCRPGKSPA